MRDTYNRLRLQVGLVVRDLEEMREAGIGISDGTSLDAIRLVADDDKKRNQEAVGELIGQGHVTPTMGSSLINDSVFSHHLSKNLIQAAKPLFVTDESELNDAIKDVELDESDLTDIANRT